MKHVQMTERQFYKLRAKAEAVMSPGNAKVVRGYDTRSQRKETLQQYRARMKRLNKNG